MKYNFCLEILLLRANMSYGIRSEPFGQLPHSMWQGLDFLFCFEKKELFVSVKLVVGDCGDKPFETFLIICCNLLCRTMDSSPLF